MNRKWTFCNIRQRFAFIFGRVIPITARQLSITNMAASRYYKKENASLPVDVCQSKTTHFWLTCVTQKRLTSGGRVLLKNDSLPVDVCHSKTTLLWLYIKAGGLNKGNYNGFLKKLRLYEMPVKLFQFSDYRRKSEVRFLFDVSNLPSNRDSRIQII